MALPNNRPNVIELIAATDSNIARISLYPQHAEVTRHFKVLVQAGMNQVHVDGLPNNFMEDMLRIEGRGTATFHDATVSFMPRKEQVISAELGELMRQEERLQRARDRTTASLGYTDAYMKSLHIQNLEATKLRGVIEEADSVAEMLEDKQVTLVDELFSVQNKIKEESEKDTGEKESRLRTRVSVGIYADVEGAIELTIIYVSQSASWYPAYDCRASLQGNTSFSLTYKAVIHQETGEDWNDVSLTLETATPTFGVGIPTLSPWYLSVARLVEHVLQAPIMLSGTPMMMPMIMPRSRSRSRRRSRSRSRSRLSRSRSPRSRLSRSRSPARQMNARPLNVTSGQANITATFLVPGLVTIPDSFSDSRNITIVQLNNLDVQFSWLCVPKADRKVHLKAKIWNNSEYTLLPGDASVYLDGSFIAKSRISAVSPNESFD